MPGGGNCRTRVALPRLCHHTTWVLSPVLVSGARSLIASSIRPKRDSVPVRLQAKQGISMVIFDEWPTLYTLTYSGSTAVSSTSILDTGAAPSGAADQLAFSLAGRAKVARAVHELFPYDGGATAVTRLSMFGVNFEAAGEVARLDKFVTFTHKRVESPVDSRMNRHSTRTPNPAGQDALKTMILR